MSRNNRPPRQTFGLNLERLEAREVPANYFWVPPTGSNFLSTTAGNWMQGPGAPWAYHTDAPNYDDNLIFRGDLTQAGCTIFEPPPPPTPSQPAFESIQLLFYHPESGQVAEGEPPPQPQAYWGTVTTADSFRVGSLTVECGYIKQQDFSTINSYGHAGTLTIDSSLTWTGGTLNSNGIAGHIDLAPGATGVAEPSFTNPGINGVVKLGSTLTLGGTDPVAETGLGSTLNMIGGTFEIIRGEIITEAFSNLFLIADKKADPLKGTVTFDKKEDGFHSDKVLGVNPKGVATVTTKRDADAPDTIGEVKIGSADADGVILNHGTIVVKNHTKLILNGMASSTLTSYLQTTKESEPSKPANPDPVTRLETSSAIECLTVSGDISFVNGTLEVPRRVIGTALSEDTQGLLKATTVRLWKDAVVTMPGDGWNTLRIEGTFSFDGEFRAAIGRVSDISDKIEVTGKVTVNEDKAKLTLRWDTAVVLAGWRDWPLLTSEDTITNCPNDNLETLDGAGSVRVRLTEDSKKVHAYRHMD